MKMCTSRLAICIAWAISVPALAQDIDPKIAQPPAPKVEIGERWDVVTLYEFYGAKDREPSRRERKQTKACLPAKQLAPVDLIGADIPDSLQTKCWQKDKRAEENRAQVKYMCSDGSSIEAVVRRESADLQGSQIAINIDGKGAISITRQMRRVAGSACAVDVSGGTQANPPSK